MRVVLGITSSIAAYKIPILIRQLTKHGHEVRVVQTENSAHFVTTELLSLLSGNKAIIGSNYFSELQSVHIELARWGDVMLIAPADFNIIGKVASGVADDIVSTTIASFKGPVLLAPAMHDTMWNNPILQDNVRYLMEKGYLFSGPVEGNLYSGDVGAGRLIDTEYIIEDLFAAYRKTPLKGKKVLLVYGRTEESIDDVRVITNRSSGRMGIALAKEFKKNGAYLIQIVGKIDSQPYGRDEIHRATTTHEMKEKIMQCIEKADILVMAAAVSDFMPGQRIKGKVKREKNFTLSLNLVKTEDILKSIGHKKGSRIFVGFALSEDIEKDAPLKLREKKLDMIVANLPVSMEGSTSEGFILKENSDKILFRQISKDKLSELIVKELISIEKS